MGEGGGGKNPSGNNAINFSSESRRIERRENARGVAAIPGSSPGQRYVRTCQDSKMIINDNDPRNVRAPNRAETASSNTRLTFRRILARKRIRVLAPLTAPPSPSLPPLCLVLIKPPFVSTALCSRFFNFDASVPLAETPVPASGCAARRPHSRRLRRRVFKVSTITEVNNLPPLSSPGGRIPVCSPRGK